MCKYKSTGRRWISPSQLLTSALLLLAAVEAMVEVPNEEEWVSCKEFKETAALSNCLCYVSEDEGFKINCDHVVFSQDFPTLPFRQPITYFSQRFVNYQNIPPQAFLPSGSPLQTLDLSNNWLRRLTEKSFEGLTETLEILDLSHNLFGDQLNPIFSTTEFKRLPRLRALTLGNNQLSHIDGGILDGCLSLEEFYLDNNEIKSVPSTSLKGPNALKILDLSYNQIGDIRPDDFVQVPALIMLNISRNEVVQVHGASFRGLSSLKVLDLSWNRILRLNSDSFMGLATIEELDLSNNFLTQIPIAALKVLPTLKILRLSANLLQNLDGMLLKSLTSVEVLDLSRNRLSEIPKGFFNGMVNLKEINLGVNQLRTLSPTIFEGVTKILKLNLMDNNLLTFPAAALEPLTTLTSLNLDFNRISALTPMKIHNLTELSIANNLIREVPPDTFSSFPALNFLNLYGNLMETIDISLPPNLLELNLGLNHIRSIPRFQLPSLEILKLNKNQVSGLVQHNFVLLGNLRELDLSSNMITSFFGNSFDGLDSLLDLDLSGNKLEYLPKFGNLFEVEILNFSRNHLKEIGLLENMDNLKLLDLSSNQITNMRPETFKNTTNLFTLDLKNNKMNSFKGFEGTFERLKTLDLSKNHISYVYPNSFQSFGQLWNLNLNDNRFSLFPTEFLKPCKQLRYIGLARNSIKNLNEMNFSNFPYLRQLELNDNSIEFVIQNAFLNSTQLQVLDLSGNKLENLDANIFHGLLRLELDISNNYLSYLPPSIFDRGHVQKLHKINLSKNAFQSIPSDALQKQYFYLEELQLSDNKIKEVAPNLNILVNVKTLDLSFNPLDDLSLKNILNEPKTVRSLNLANCSIKMLPVLEMPFLRELNISGNSLGGFDDTVFQRSTLLEKLDLSRNQFFNLDPAFPGSLKYLDLSSNPLSIISGGNFPQSLEVIKLNHLESVLKVEKTSLNLKNLKQLEVYDLPKLGYLDIRGLLTNLHYLESFEFEVKDQQIVDQIHPGLNARIKKIGLRGRRVRSISTGAFAGLTSPDVTISLINTSLSILPSILVPVPMSSNIMLDITGSKITNLSPPFLSQNIKLEGLAPICDCNAVNLVRYLQSVDSNVICAGPKRLEGTSVLNLSLDDLTCDSGSSTTPPPIPSTVSTTTTTQDDIIWSIAPVTTGRTNGGNKKKSDKESTRKVIEAGAGGSKVKGQEVNNMDSLIFGIVGGVIVLIVLFVIIIVCFVKITNRSSSNDGLPGGGGIYPPAAPSVVSVGPHGYGHTSSKCTCTHKGHPPQFMMAAAGPYGTVRSNTGKLMQYPTLSPNFNGGGGGGGIYAVHPAAMSMSNGPSSLTMAPQNSPYINANYANSMGPSSLISQRHHHQQQQQQQQQMFTSMPYYIQESEYESRR